MGFRMEQKDPHEVSVGFTSKGDRKKPHSWSEYAQVGIAGGVLLGALLWTAWRLILLAFGHTQPPGDTVGIIGIALGAVAVVWYIRKYENHRH